MTIFKVGDLVCLTDKAFTVPHLSLKRKEKVVGLVREVGNKVVEVFVLGKFVFCSTDELTLLQTVT